MANGVLRAGSFSSHDSETFSPNQVCSHRRRVHFEDDEACHLSTTAGCAREQDGPSRHDEEEVYPLPSTTWYGTTWYALGPADKLFSLNPTSPELLAEPTPDTTTATDMSLSPPFEVPEAWRRAMAMISINAGFTPQLILHEFYRRQRIQAPRHPSFTVINFDNDPTAYERGIKSVHICYRDTNPSMIYQVVITINEQDPVTNRDAFNIVTHTSIRHVLEEPCADCQLWLPARPDQHAQSGDKFHILPCCDAWIESMAFDKPLSETEKRMPAVVDLLIREVHRQAALLQDKDKELAMLKAGNLGGEGSAAHVGRHPGQLHVEGLLQHWWWLGAVLVGFLIVVIFK